MQMRSLAVLAVGFGGLTFGGAALAQPEPNPAAPTPANPARPQPGEAITIDDRATAIDRDPVVADALRLLVGSRRAIDNEAVGGTGVALRYGAAPIVVDGLDNAVYFEISREDDPANPFRQGVLHFYKNKGNLRLRIFELPQGIRDACTGLWIAPGFFPGVAATDLTPNLDYDMTVKGPLAIWGATTCPVPVNRDGAVEMISEIGLEDEENGRLRIAERGFNARGEQVWGTAAPNAIKFLPAEPIISSTTSEEGLVIVTLAQPAPGAPRHEPGGTIVMHFTGWLTDGRQFESSRLPGREPQRMQVPAPIPIKGFNEGVSGIAVGERRRLVIPPALGFGEQGNPRGGIPANATLIFDIECLHVDPPAPMTAPGGDQPTTPGLPPGSTQPLPRGNPPAAATPAAK